MRIGVKSNFELNQTDFETQSATLGDLLDELSEKSEPLKTEFFDCERREIYPDCEVVVNGQEFGALADGLNTKLEDDDTVEIYLIIMAGG